MFGIKLHIYLKYKEARLFSKKIYWLQNINFSLFFFLIFNDQKFNFDDEDRI